MSYEIFGADAPGVAPCRYGESRLLFRGPKRETGGPYIAVLGGTEVYGRYVETPFSEILESELNRTVLNLGCINAGLDSFMRDTEILKLARSAQMCVVQLMGAQNLTNRYFRVHPRRNDRFLEAMPALCELYPEVDFTEFHFNRHLLNTIRSVSEKRFALVQRELQRVWVGRMRLLLRALGDNVVLLWLRYGPVGTGWNIDREPPLVTRDMVAALGRLGEKVLVIDLLRADEADELPDMVVGELHMPAAGHVIGPAAHRKVAEVLKPLLQ
jgi:hypothetical protein